MAVPDVSNNRVWAREREERTTQIERIKIFFKLWKIKKNEKNNNNQIRKTAQSINWFTVGKKVGKMVWIQWKKQLN